MLRSAHVFFSRLLRRKAGTAAPPDSDSTAVRACACFHCGLSMLPGTDLWVEFKGARKPVCCPGCRAIAVFAISNGLTALYHGRDGNAGAA